jgi:hypothetical protein
MGWAYSVHLRERVVAAFDREGMTDQEAAASFPTSACSTWWQ